MNLGYNKPLCLVLSGLKTEFQRILNILKPVLYLIIASLFNKSLCELIFAPLVIDTSDQNCLMKFGHFVILFTLVIKITYLLSSL